MIKCPAGHWFTGPIESLTWETSNNHHPGTTGAGSSNGPGQSHSWPPDLGIFRRWVVTRSGKLPTTHP